MYFSRCDRFPRTVSRVSNNQPVTLLPPQRPQNIGAHRRSANYRRVVRFTIERNVGIGPTLKRHEWGGCALIALRTSNRRRQSAIGNDLVRSRAGLGSIACPEACPEGIGLRFARLWIAEVLLQVFGHADPEVEHGRAGSQIDAGGKGCQVSHLRIVVRRD